jgi:hypothetical protein
MFTGFRKIQNSAQNAKGLDFSFTQKNVNFQQKLTETLYVFVVNLIFRFGYT